MPDNWDGLVRVKPKKMDAAYVAPGTDFRTYTKVMLDPGEVAFKKDWMRDVNDSSAGVSKDVTDEDAQKILAAARDGLDQIFKETFEKAGIQVVTTPGRTCCASRPAWRISISTRRIRCPPAGRGLTRPRRGRATFVLEARDSMTGALLGRVFDRRETRQSGGVQWATSVSNRADFSQLFKSWANICVKGLSELKENSPVPADLQPNQKL
jgi:hypothetical protein